MMKRLFFLNWYRILRAHLHLTMLQAIRCSLWLTR
jgi:hypothetical protein